MSFRIRRQVTVLTLAVALPFAAVADPVPAPEGVLSLSSSATLEVTRDLLSVTFSTTREGTDAAAVQSQLKQALDAALAEARRAARPGQVDVQTGNFSISPRYTNKGEITGWQGSAELGVEGRDLAAIGQLSGRIKSLTVARVGYSISRELREKSEGEVAAQAIQRYRAKAAEVAHQFGYAGYTVREVNVSSSDGQALRPMMMQAKALAPGADDALPVEPGKGSIVVNVNGTVQMTH